MNLFSTFSTFFFIILHFGAQIVWSAETCGTDEYSPCQCSDSFSSPSIACYEVPVEQVQKVFERLTVQNFENLYWVLNPNESNASIPADVLSNAIFTSIIFSIPGDAYQFQIHPDAFRSTSPFTEEIYFESGDWRQQLDYAFLNGFDRLSHLTFTTTLNVPSIGTLPPSLPSLSILEFYRSTGLEKLTETLNPIHLPKLRSFSLGFCALTDESLDQILQSILSSTDTLEAMSLFSNSLTHVPRQLASFASLNRLELTVNNIIELSAKSLTFSANIVNLDLDQNAINKIEPGAFQGNFSGALVTLRNNSLAQFESAVFQPMLEQMFQSSSGILVIPQNPFDCGGCGLSWLIQDNPGLLNHISGGVCANSTRFENLDPNGFNDCI